MIERVLAEGDKQARIMLIGECPGEKEMELGRPFVGQAGKVLEGILDEVGLVRSQLYITNVMQTRPAGNNFKLFYTKVKGRVVPSVELLEGYERLRNEIASVRPNVIVPMGNEPMKALLGHGGIVDYRGSILQSPYGKVVPTIHPAAVLRKWEYRPAVISDFTRIIEESVTPDVRYDTRELVVAYSMEQALEELRKLKEAKYVTFDIEEETDQVTCIGFASGREQAVCIPFWYGDSGSLRTTEEEVRIWEEIKSLLEDERVLKVAHNGNYDIGELDRLYGIEVKGFAYDTQLMGHTLYPELPKSLAFYTSIYTRQPYYKFMRKTDEAEVHFRYNALDCCVTYEVKEKMLLELAEEKMEPFYQRYLHDLVGPMLRMERKGVLFDKKRCMELRAVYRRGIARLERLLNAQTGKELNARSPDQMKSWLYGELKLPKQYQKDKVTGEKKLTVNEEALRNLIKERPDVKGLKTILAIREKEKIYGTYLKVTLDSDDHIRCNFNISGTETGRLSSSKTLRGTGTNLQNIPGGVVKSLFLAEGGCVLINADLSQAEARVVAYLAGESRLIKVFEEGGDIHRKNAANIFGKSESEVSDEERQMAKRVVHASHYGMGPATFAKDAGIPLGRAKALLNQYFATYPRIKIWHMQVADSLRKSRVMRTPFGRKRVFFNKWSESVLREGLAYVPQSVVPDIINQGIVELDKQGVDVRLQVHDSILCTELDSFECVTQTVEKIRQALTCAIEINGKVFVIPVDFKVGYNWQEMYKLKDWLVRYEVKEVAVSVGLPGV